MPPPVPCAQLQSSFLNASSLPVKFKRRIKPPASVPLKLPPIPKRVCTTTIPSYRDYIAYRRLKVPTRFPQFVCMLYSPGSSSYTSTPRNFDDVSHLHSHPYLPDGSHSRPASHFTYPEQQLNSSSRNPHPLSQRGQTNNSSNFNSNYSAFREYRPHHDQRRQLNNSSPPNPVHQEYCHHPSQNGQHHNPHTASFARVMPNQHQYSNTDTAFPFPPVISPAMSASNSIQQETPKVPMLQTPQERIDEPLFLYRAPHYYFQSSPNTCPSLVNESLRPRSMY